MSISPWRFVYLTWKCCLSHPGVFVYLTLAWLSISPGRTRLSGCGGGRGGLLPPLNLWATSRPVLSPSCGAPQTMKRIVDALSGGDAAKTAAAAAGEGKEAPAALSTNSYLFIFLKFIGSVVPTIEYDFTFATAARK